MKKIYWRMFAIIILLVWTVVFIANNYLFLVETKSAQEIFITNILYLVPFLFFGLLVFFPTKFILYAIVCCYLGLNGLFWGGKLASMLMYCLGCGFVFRAGLLFKNKGIPLLLFALPIVTIASQYRLGIVVLVETFIDLLFVITFLVLSYVILKETVWHNVNPFAKNISAQKRNLSVLTFEELVIVLAVLENKTFASIGNEIHKSESAVKQYMVGIYKKLDIESKKELLDLQKNDLLNFPE